MKKILVFILAVAVLCSIAVGTTLTYFTDTDFDANTMTVGKVEIEQYEKDRTGAAIDNDGLKLYPVTSGLVDGLIPVANNGVDKVVTVKNTGSENAYVRTIFAFEMMKKVTNVNGEDVVTWESPINDEVVLVQSGITMTDVTFTKDGVQYVIGVCTYGELAVGATTAPSLKQIYLHKDVGNEFSTAVGGVYDILVLSQAVQTQGFGDAETALNTAFCALTAENAQTIASWFPHN